jgi:hypothetical protein
MAAIFVDFVKLLSDYYSSNSKTYSDVVNNVAKDTESDILSILVPTAKKFILLGGSASCFTDTTFRFYVDSSLKETKKSNWCERNVLFSMNECALSGKIIKITAEHKSLKLQNFQASIFGVLLDA